jgi:hypothetical protein
MADTFKAVNERILMEAIGISVANSSRRICFALWDGLKRGSEDFSAHFVEHATTLNFPIVNINTD